MTDGVSLVVKCPDCVETRVAPRDVTIRHCVDDDTWSYRFECPLCRRRGVAATGKAAAMDAIGAGSSFEPWHFPAEFAERPVVGPPISDIDVLEFHLDIQEPDWMDELARFGHVGA